jgi:hypothetical protein
MKPRVYIETTIPSLLTAWPSRDVEIAAQQIATREWWEKRRADFELYVSPEVLNEAAQGDAEAARVRLEAIATLPVLAVTDEVEELTRRILTTGLIPPRATRDARAHCLCDRPWDGLPADLELSTHP